MKARADLIGWLIGAGGVLLWLAAFAAVELPAARPMRTDLRRVYAPSRVTILTLKTADFVESCGWYRAGADPQRWRYLSTRDGLWAEGLSGGWRQTADDPSAAPLPDRDWQLCMHTSGRGHLMDFMMGPIVAAYLNAT